MRRVLAKQLKLSPQTYTGVFIKSTLGFNRYKLCVHTMLLRDVRTSDGRRVGSDGHIWVVTSYPMYGLKEGDRIQFIASVGMYKRRDGTSDYAFTHIEKIQKIEG